MSLLRLLPRITDLLRAGHHRKAARTISRSLPTDVLIAELQRRVPTLDRAAAEAVSALVREGQDAGRYIDSLPDDDEVDIEFLPENPLPFADDETLHDFLVDFEIDILDESGGTIRKLRISYQSHRGITKGDAIRDALRKAEAIFSKYILGGMETKPPAWHAEHVISFYAERRT